MSIIENKLNIATRSSPLAIKQCEIIQGLLPDVVTKIVKIVTKGDQILDKSLSSIGGKGLFVKKLEKALLQNKADIAIHSMKDMEWILAAGTSIGAVIKRGSRRDLLIGKWKSFDELPIGAKIGTSSVRRKAFLLSFRSDLNISLLRGNINTRLDAIKILKSKKNLRIIDASNFSLNEILKFNSVNESMLVQFEDKKIFSKKDFKIVSKKKTNQITIR